ncbi:MAG: hypothetical protein A2W86_13585 [Bacteroidetes bacterium GWD2_45_23]|nr:MAG: hypothetical protein A2W87_03015 [Bacteroidetes bacterium GWC2_46_850]OFX75838.1 MAG: hypothetical protein A2071_10170 [Bacteroidetes bacterium GWC1_47_7]OFX84679.1 MAG: hypothetical protein A2W86_13585 [Bacteroidetes bacterium GWD2_45_23]HBB00605.1 hypothetical protein [Porphyromonadaceae bacterium]HCC18254.1 hypothetical protein [Porphyromonadaceae bacterium]
MSQALNAVVGRLAYDMGIHPNQIQTENPAAIEDASLRRTVTAKSIQTVNETLLSLYLAVK